MGKPGHQQLAHAQPAPQLAHEQPGRATLNNTIPLQDLFNNRIFRVPDYQRGYAWEKLQIGEFLDDLELLGSTHHRHHYTGTIVLYQPGDAARRTSAEGRSYVEAAVVDGQQRLTTIVLLLNEISRALSDNGSPGELAQGIKKDYVEVKSRDGLPLYKLSLNEETDKFFKDSILPTTPGVDGPPTAAARRLQDAKNQIAGYLSTASKNAPNGEQWLQDLVEKITTLLHFNVYQVDHPSEVGIVFELVNDRGKPLTNLEKVKNYLLYTAATLDIETYARDDLTKAINEAWAFILGRLASAGLGSPAEEDQLLRVHWIIDYDSGNWDGSKSIKQRFDLRRYQKEHAKLLGELHDYVKGLREACICYCDALKPARDGAFESFASEPAVREDVKLWNSRLVRTRVTATFLPLLIAVRKRWTSEPKKYLEVVKLFELIAFRFYRVADFRTNYRQSQMFGLAQEVARGMEFDDAVRAIRQLYSDPGEYARRHFDEFTDPSKPQSWFWRGYLSYFLYEYELHLASAGFSDTNTRPKVGWAEIRGRRDSIEHILPQSIEGRPCWQKRFDGDAHDSYVHDIGNLTLTEQNSRLGNSEFAKKRDIYATSRLFQELEIAQHDDWTPEAIDKRRAKLLAWAKERWHMDFSGLDEAEPEPVDEEQGDSNDDTGEGQTPRQVEAFQGTS